MANTYFLEPTNITDTSVDIKVKCVTAPSSTADYLTIRVLEEHGAGTKTIHITDPGTAVGQIVGTASFTSLTPETDYYATLSSPSGASAPVPYFKTKVAHDTPRVATQEQWENLATRVKAKADNSAFTGTDGVNAGTAGLVPAPATTDAGKFLKADGTWDTAGGGIPLLTSSDYNWPTNNPQGIAYWLLADGIYRTESGTRFYYGDASSSWDAVERVFTVETADSTYKSATAIQPNEIKYYKNNKTTGEVANGYPKTVITGSVVQTTGTSQTNVMSQDATSSMVFDDPGTAKTVKIGNSASSGNQGVAVGFYASSISEGIAVGRSAKSTGFFSAAVGSYSVASRQGEVNVGTGTNSYGYNSTSYRVIGGVHDGQDAHDAATVAQGNTLATSAPTTSTVGVLGQLYTDTTNMHTYQCTAISGSTYTWTQRW